jgi:fucose 4-O-acetylase-like acetyltransferase
MSNREIIFDYVRFIAILLVVFGHLIQYNVIDFDNNYFFKIIYSFHMPLFMFVSGYVSYYSLFLRKSFYTDFHKKVLSILYPFFLWTILVQLISYSQFDIINIILSPQAKGGYWFLWALFWIWLFFKVAIVSSSKNKYLFLLYCIFISFIFFGPFSKNFDLGLIKYMSLYFTFGLLSFKFKNKILTMLDKLNHNIFIFMLIGLFLFLSMYYARSETFYYELFNNTAIYIKILSYIFKITLALLGILINFKIAEMLMSFFKKSNIILNIDAKYTLEIYITHFFFIQVFTYNLVLNLSLVSAFIFILYISLESKYGYFIKKILFGRN